MLIHAFRFPYRPVAAQIIPIRRCNLSCPYCNEYDDCSEPVPTHEMLRRIDKLATLGTGVVTLSGGEPLLHPDLDEIVRRIRSHGRIATLITNGYLLSRTRIARLRCDNSSLVLTTIPTHRDTETPGNLWNSPRVPLLPRCVVIINSSELWSRVLRGHFRRASHRMTMTGQERERSQADSCDCKRPDTSEERERKPRGSR